MIIILIYLSLCLLALVIAYTRKGITLLRIKTIFWINLIFLIISMVSSVFFPSYTPMIFFALLVIISSFIYKLWFLLNYESKNVQEVIETSLSLVLTPFTKTGNKYDITVGGYPASLKIITILHQTSLLTFSGNWKYNKGRVIQSLFRKKFRSLFPKLVIHLKSYAKDN